MSLLPDEKASQAILGKQQFLGYIAVAFVSFVLGVFQLFQ